MMWAATAATGWGDPTNISALGQWGVLGLVVYALYKAHQWFVQREAARGDRLEAKNEALNNVIANMQERNLPALTSATEAIQEAMTLIRDMHRERGRETKEDR